jgi:FKBP-type peptidyl-prolyl cis-trans isomerase
MRLVTVAVLLLASSLILSSCGNDGSGTSATELTSFTQKASYALGLDIADNLKQSGMEFDIAALTLGFEDALAGQPPRLSAEEIAQIMQEFQTKAQAAVAEQQQAQGEINLREGNDFLAQNKDQEGVTTTDSGLQYRVLEEGEGPSPKAEDQVTVHYRGTLINGTEFDSSYQRGQPATFAVNRVIAGWTEALQLMKVGGKYRLFIPPQLAYGEQGAGPQIGPNSTLIFDVELLKIEE